MSHCLGGRRRGNLGDRRLRRRLGQALAGSKLPNLTYLLAFDDEAALAKAWTAFRSDAEWTRLKNDESYKDTVTTITNLVLRPTAGSQV